MNQQPQAPIANQVYYNPANPGMHQYHAAGGYPELIPVHGPAVNNPDYIKLPPNLYDYANNYDQEKLYNYQQQ